MFRVEWVSRRVPDVAIRDTSLVSRATIVIVVLGSATLGPTVAHAQEVSGTAPAVGPASTYEVRHLRYGGASTPGLVEPLLAPPLPAATVASSGSLWRGTLIGAAAGFVASIVAWQLVQEGDDDSILNGYAAAAGVVVGGLIGLSVAIVL